MINKLVRHLKRLNPWLIVRWAYYERDKHGLRLIKKEGCTYLYKALITYAIVALCDQGLMWCGFDYKTGDFIIFDE